MLDRLRGVGFYMMSWHWSPQLYNNTTLCPASGWLHCTVQQAVLWLSRSLALSLAQPSLAVQLSSSLHQISKDLLSHCHLAKGMAEPVAVAPAPLMAVELTVATQNCNSLNLTTNIRSYELKISAIKNLDTDIIFLCNTRLVSNKGTV